MRVVQALARSEREPRPGLWFVTRCATGAGGAAEPISVAQAPLVGFVRTAANEHPGLRPRLVDLGPEPVHVAIRELGPATAKPGQGPGPLEHRAVGLGAELVIVFGASAIADRRDVIPAAITEIGGAVEHFGMPVDPGNLLLIGSAGGVPVLGAPGCARSPVRTVSIGFWSGCSPICR
jgi:hypothetical protein